MTDDTYPNLGRRGTGPDGENSPGRRHTNSG
jgi:hypothetical protein